MLTWQVLSRSYSSWRYWGAVVLVSIFGTMVADAMHVVAGVTYLASSVTFAVTLSAILTLWQRAEGTISIHTITSLRRATFYWATILATFAFGTAVGDLAASLLGLGHSLSGVVFAILFALPFLGRRARLIGEISAFWTAYVITRPLGASFADWMGVGNDRGGLDWGTGWVSLALASLVVSMLLLPRSAAEAL